MKIIQVKHPLIEHSLTILRKNETRSPEFRQHASIVSKILIVEATKRLQTTDVTVETPLTETVGQELSEQTVVVPVLRAGLAMLFAAQDILLNVSVGFLGMERDEKTAIAREYYQKLPALIKKHHVIVLDPMLATGGSIDETVSALERKGAESTTLVCVVAAPEGIKRIENKYPNTTLVVGAIDSHLDESKYIVPGLGDFGDRYFGT